MLYSTLMYHSLSYVYNVPFTFVLMYHSLLYNVKPVEVCNVWYIKPCGYVVH